MYDKTFQAKVMPVIISEFNEHVASVFDGRLYAIVAPPLATFPCGVYQSQDGGGLNKDFIGSDSGNGWEGMMTIRCLDTTLSGAWSKALDVAVALQTITNPIYDMNIHLEKPQWFPVEKLTIGNIYTAGLIVLIGVYPKTS